MHRQSIDITYIGNLPQGIKIWMRWSDEIFAKNSRWITVFSQLGEERPIVHYHEIKYFDSLYEAIHRTRTSEGNNQAIAITQDLLARIKFLLKEDFLPILPVIFQRNPDQHPVQYDNSKLLESDIALAKYEQRFNKDGKIKSNKIEQ